LTCIYALNWVAAAVDGYFWISSATDRPCFLIGFHRSGCGNLGRKNTHRHTRRQHACRTLGTKAIESDPVSLDKKSSAPASTALTQSVTSSWLETIIMGIFFVVGSFLSLWVSSSLSILGMLISRIMRSGERSIAFSQPSMPSKVSLTWYSIRARNGVHQKAGHGIIIGDKNMTGLFHLLSFGTCEREILIQTRHRPLFPLTQQRSPRNGLKQCCELWQAPVRFLISSQWS